MSRRIHVTRDRLIEWVRYRQGELALHQLSDGALVLLSCEIKPGDVLVTDSGEYPVPDELGEPS